MLQEQQLLLVVLRTLLDSRRVGSLTRSTGCFAFPDQGRSCKVQASFGETFELEDVCMNPTPDLPSSMFY